MKFWKTVRNITIIIFIIIIFFMIRDVIICMHMEYPHPILGTDAYNFWDQFKMNFIFYFSVPLFIDIICFVISCIKMRNNK